MTAAVLVPTIAAARGGGGDSRPPAAGSLALAGPLGVFCWKMSAFYKAD